MAEQVPNWQEIDTPWDQQPIAWRYSNSLLRKRALRTLASEPTRPTHLVREVLVHDPETRAPATSVQRIWEVLKLTNDELHLLRECGVAAPIVEWHVFESSPHARALARVAIIDGYDTYDYPPASSCEYAAYSSWRQGIDQYIHTPGFRVEEFTDWEQYRNGVPRTEPHANSALHLVDVEPAYWTEIR
jgi:hypothetical protein